MKPTLKLLPIAVAVAIGAVGCSENSPQEPGSTALLETTSSPSVAMEESPTPSMEPFPTPTPSVNEKNRAEENSEYSPDELREMSVDEFVDLPIEDREVLIVDMLEESVDWSFLYGENWEGDTSNLYEFNPLKIASEDNALEEIVMQGLYMQQLALSQTLDLDTDGTFDPDTALKGLTGAYISEEYLTEDATETVSDTRGYELGAYNLPSVGDSKAEFAQAIDVLHDDAESYIKKMTTPDGRKLTIAAAHYEVVLKEDAGKIYPANTRVQFKDKYVFHPDLGRWLIYSTWSNGRAGVE